MRSHFLLAVIALGAQVAAPDQATFRAGVDVVRVDVSVLSADRKPVSGLVAGDFEITENGKPRPIMAFTAVDVPTPLPASPEAAGWVRNVASDVASNDSHDVRRIAIVMDDAMTFPEPRVSATAKAIARQMVDRLGPGDQAAIVFTYFPGAAQAFTTDRVKLFAAIDRFQPRYRVSVRRGDFGGVDFDDAATYASARTLSNIADYLIGVPDRRKAIAFISPGAAVNLLATSPTADEALAIVEMRQVLERTARANVTLFGFDPTGLEGPASYLYDQLVSAGIGNEAAFAFAQTQAARERQFIESTADNTGGYTIRNTNSFEAGVATMFEQLSSYYLIGFEPADPKKDGAWRRVEVKVRRPGLTVLARNAYNATIAGAPRPADVSAGAAVDRAIHATGVSADVSLRAATAVFAQQGSKASRVAIVVGVDLPRSNDGRQLVEKADLLVRAFDSDGNARDTRAVSVDVALRPTTVTHSYYEILTDMELAPGRYELRMAVRSAVQDRVGSVFQQVDVPDWKAALSLSDLVFSTTPALHSAPTNAFAGLLPVVPTASREFPRSIAVRAFARVYRGEPALNGDVTVRTTVRNAAGVFIVDQSSALATTEFGDRRSADLSVEVPVNRLPAGDYLLEVEARAGQTTARRQIRFVVMA